MPALTSPAAQVAAYALIASGNVLVLSSMWALGITGTYLGDYFGILMDHRVTTFPFNVTDAPMYYGSALSFFGTAVLYAKPAGILLTVEVLAVYLVALQFEESVHYHFAYMTDMLTAVQSVHCPHLRKKGSRGGES